MMGTLRRLACYLSQMFCPWVMLPIGFANFFAICWTLQLLNTRSPVLMNWRSVGGACTVVLFALLMRVYDDFKDAEADIRLGRSGDPRYSDRAIVTGKTTMVDLLILRRCVTALLIIINLLMFETLCAVAFVVLYGVGWLSYKWFFIPVLRSNLLLAFVTHSPITLLVSAYVAAVYASDFGFSSLSVWTVPLLVGLWMLVTAWETSRKIRIPEDETEYQTYSKMLGCKAAALLPALFAAVAVTCLAPVMVRARLGTAALIVLACVAAILINACLGFCLAPTRERAKLQPYAEFFAAATNITFVIAAWIGHGAVFV